MEVVSLVSHPNTWKTTMRRYSHAPRLAEAREKILTVVEILVVICSGRSTSRRRTVWRWWSTSRSRSTSRGYTSRRWRRRRRRRWRRWWSRRWRHTRHSGWRSGRSHSKTRHTRLEHTKLLCSLLASPLVGAQRLHSLLVLVHLAEGLALVALNGTGVLQSCEQHSTGLVGGLGLFQLPHRVGDLNDTIKSQQTIDLWGAVEKILLQERDVLPHLLDHHFSDINTLVGGHGCRPRLLLCPLQLRGGQVSSPRGQSGLEGRQPMLADSGKCVLEVHQISHHRRVSQQVDVCSHLFSQRPGEGTWPTRLNSGLTISARETGSTVRESAFGVHLELLATMDTTSVPAGFFGHEDKSRSRAKSRIDHTYGSSFRVKTAKIKSDRLTANHLNYRHVSNWTRSLIEVALFPDASVARRLRRRGHARFYGSSFRVKK